MSELERAWRGICEWMAPTGPGKMLDGRWWGSGKIPRAPTLDALWEVEERLTDAQSREYDHLLYMARFKQKRRFPSFEWHADAAEKALALWKVIQPVDTGRMVK